MVAAADGNFYGITRQLGSEIMRFFRMTPAGVVTILQTLPSPGGGGNNAGIIEAADGNFYTTTTSYPYQVVRITRTGGYKILPLPTNADAVYGLVAAPSGYVYGVCIKCCP